jgi:curved DNA-binding protein CbpA
MRPAHDLYGELGIRADATAAEIDRAYRRRARAVHPDAGGSAEAFQALSRAYEILSDPERRRLYDETGETREPPRDTVTARAMQHIGELVGSVLDSDVPFEGVDLVAAIRDTLAKQAADVAAAIARLDNQAQRAEAMARRFRRASGENLIRRTLERRAGEIRRSATRMQKEADAFAKAIEILADYDFDVDSDGATLAALERPPQR